LTEPEQRLAGRTGLITGAASGIGAAGAELSAAHGSALVGLDPGWFPEVVEAGTVVGHVSALAFSQTGLAAGTPVVAGGLDTALGLAGPGQPVPGRLTVTGGSFWKQTVVAPAPVVEPAGRLRTICHVRPDQWLVEGISWYAGFALRWLRDGAASRPVGYAELEELAAAVPPGARGLTARLARADAWTWARWQPPFPPRPDAPAAGLGEQARAIQEAAAYTTRQASGLISELVGPGAGQQVTLTGGAARSRLWPQILADVLGCPVGVAEHTESAALGAAILAGRAAGVRLEDPPPGSRPAATMRPSLAGQQAYAQLYARWRSADQWS
jgi:autoinducer 2 (AI-2) kinase